MMNEKRQCELYMRAGNSYGSWLLSADSLLASARILYDNFDPCIDLPVGSEVPDRSKIFSTIFLLYGFCIECLFKCLWVKNGNNIVDNGKYIGIPGANDHKLHELADKVNFSLSGNERDALISLSVIITSSGRYPVSKCWSDTKIQRRQSGGFCSRATREGHHLELAENIISRIYKMLDFKYKEYKKANGACNNPLQKTAQLISGRSTMGQDDA